MINLEEIVTTHQKQSSTNNSNYNNLDNMVNNNKFHGGFLIGILGGLIILGCLLPFLKLKALKTKANTKSAPIQQTATLIK